MLTNNTPDSARLWQLDHHVRYAVTRGTNLWSIEERLVIVTQHIRNVETLTSTQNDQLRRPFLMDDTGPNTMTTPVSETEMKLCGKTRGRRSS
ncbi:unnamed protein product [Peronospora belbahrii]|uniref:Uncharacterized protein n=1 Tax=Peronospora belbahrii TaxID=622444 RepID=A0ABN8CVX0_9STRA|nr:unnamed protein product [Peronospora belbahrii]